MELSIQSSALWLGDVSELHFHLVVRVSAQINQDNFPIDNIFGQEATQGLGQCWATKDGYRPAEKRAAKCDGLMDNFKTQHEKSGNDKLHF